MGGIFCVSNIKKERYLQVSNLRIFQETTSVGRYKLRFRFFVSILSYPLPQGVTSDK